MAASALRAGAAGACGVLRRVGGLRGRRALRPRAGDPVATRPSVAVVGAGIVGAAIARGLAVRGARVTVLERGDPGGGATGASFAWANATSGKAPRAYFDLHRLSLGEWQELDRLVRVETGDEGVRVSGTLQWAAEGADSDELARAVREHQAQGSPVRMVEGEELRGLALGLRPDVVTSAAYTPDDLVVDPLVVTRALLAYVEAADGDVHLRRDVTAVEPEAGGVRLRTSEGDLRVDRVVLAAGTDTPALAAPLGIRVPLVESVGVLAHTAPLPPLLGPVLLSPGVHVLQRPDGRVVTGRDFAATSPEDVAALTGEALLSAAARLVPELAGVRAERVTVGRRVLPADGLPLVGRAPGEPRVYVAVTHSGISLAPILGRLVATELVEDIEVDLLAPYRPGWAVP